MALVTRRYRWVSSTDPRLQEFVAPSALVRFEYLNAVDIQVDNAVAGTESTLDEYMNTIGYVYDPTAPGYTAIDSMLEPTPLFEILNFSGQAANQIIKPCGSVTFSDFIAPRPGQLKGIMAQLLNARTAGTATVNFTVNGVVIAGTAVVFDGTNPIINGTTFLPGTAPFNVRDRLGFVVSATGGPSFLPLTSLQVLGELLWDS
jgi:hypothetical protein